MKRSEGNANTNCSEGSYVVDVQYYRVDEGIEY